MEHKTRKNIRNEKRQVLKESDENMELSAAWTALIKTLDEAVRINEGRATNAKDKSKE